MLGDAQVGEGLAEADRRLASATSRPRVHPVSPMPFLIQHLAYPPELAVVGELAVVRLILAFTTQPGIPEGEDACALTGPRMMLAS